MKCKVKNRSRVPAGFTEQDDELPAFFYAEPLPPTEKTARHRSAEVNRKLRELLA